MPLFDCFPFPFCTAPKLDRSSEQVVLYSFSGFWTNIHSSSNGLMRTIQAYVKLIHRVELVRFLISSPSPQSDLSIQFGRGAPQVANTEDGGAKHDTEDLLEALQRIKSLEGTVLEMEADTLTLQAFENDLQVQLHEATEHCSA